MSLESITQVRNLSSLLTMLLIQSQILSFKKYCEGKKIVIPGGRWKLVHFLNGF